MDKIRVTGNGPLTGEVPISGAKNSALKLMAASLLSEAPLTLSNTPMLSDMRTMAELLQSLGVEIVTLQGGHVTVLSARDVTKVRAEYDIVRKMRASINVLGPLLTRFGRAEVSLPGGCAIGARPVDLHLKALEAMGAEIDLVEGYVHACAPAGLRGAEIEFPFISVGATENALTAAVLAQGTTVIRNAAQEPEIIDLADCLNAMGARIKGAGTAQIIIDGVTSLGPATHSVVPDRIELGTFMMAPAIAGGRVLMRGGKRALVGALADKLVEAGVTIEETAEGLWVARDEGAPVKAVNVTTAPFPGFPTDLQAQMMAFLATAEGVSELEETIFENRFMHAPELLRMGANIEVHGGHARVTGVRELKGAPVMATDLRASVSLILAGLAAEGETVVSRVYHLDRGYERLEEKLSGVGALIQRVSE